MTYYVDDNNDYDIEQARAEDSYQRHRLQRYLAHPDPADPDYEGELDDPYDDI